MTIEEDILKLLEAHDCVIIPNFGGLVLNSISSRINLDENEIYPPMKRLMFNVNLKNNDGLLQNELCKKHGISYTEAGKRLEHFSNQLSNALKIERTALLKGIGKFWSASDNRIQFDPYLLGTHLPTAFGLPSLALPFIKEESEFTAIKRKIKWRYPVSIAAAVVLLVLSGLLFQHEGGFMKVEKASIASDNSKSTEKIVVPENNKTSTETVIKEKEKVETPTATESKPEYLFKNDEGFYVIAGSFSSQTNAEKLFKQLHNKGYNNCVITNEGQYFRVAYSYFEKEKDARDLKKTIKKQNAETWVLAINN